MWRKLEKLREIKTPKNFFSTQMGVIFQFVAVHTSPSSVTVSASACCFPIIYIFGFTPMDMEHDSLPCETVWVVMEEVCLQKSSDSVLMRDKIKQLNEWNKQLSPQSLRRVKR